MNTNVDNDNHKNFEDAAIDYEWTCRAFGMSSGGADELVNVVCVQCTIPASSGLFGWYRSIYDNDNSKLPDEPAVFYSSPATAAVAENMTAPPPPLEKRRNMLIECISKDAVFGERVKWVHRFVGTYPVGIGKTIQENGERDLLDVHFKAKLNLAST
ncbi:hypothetical protein BGZ99_010439 [Dissophora globulifera]|uniref:Uncharacterized protein n=1 Tax=Dissophora globulifera TaxID=979702 RepID=A0A9P6R618_9FUNG|nr:hypothetical protein BGZ99_010439 [Dissophora globulifera]